MKQTNKQTNWSKTNGKSNMLNNIKYLSSTMIIVIIFAAENGSISILKFSFSFLFISKKKKKVSMKVDLYPLLLLLLLLSLYFGWVRKLFYYELFAFRWALNEQAHLWLCFSQKYFNCGMLGNLCTALKNVSFLYTFTLNHFASPGKKVCNYSQSEFLIF